ncbi:E3 ubiquitin-protein ligase ATL6 [Bienertia sinuspersici]
MCHHKNCCNHTHHAIIFFVILSLLLLPNTPNLNLLLHKITILSSRSSKSGDVDAGFLSPPCTSTKMVMAFLYGAVFTFLLMFVLHSYGHHNTEHQDPRGSHFDSGPIPRTTSVGLVSGRTDDQGGTEGRSGGGGVGYALLRTFPTFAYSVRRPTKLGKGTSVCVICQYKFKDEELVRWLPDCDHLFHLSCIDEWLTSHKTCPCCRTDLDVITSHGSSTSNGINTTPNYIYDYFNEYSYNVFSR